MKDHQRQFLTELAELLEKNRAHISLRADAGSDWHGITGEEMVVDFEDDPEVIVLGEEQTYFTARDIRSHL